MTAPDQSATTEIARLRRALEIELREAEEQAANWAEEDEDADDADFWICKADRIRAALDPPAQIAKEKAE